ncbi:MAG TPA: Stp1/IreP family PP2C-type Ser/Thr phosphatase, partial [Candidatus Syntrophosphaera sp.]|jgi:serine/threonine protein phosphatase PrpC|nr:Stp1/IreP family PP2C-type Ser/Thr phosphatase [Candidatus Syntrophosphaera sp.]HRQ67544.1 Stp1/IreP family PP2C-type Ser/Thr phosphatase [Candidatus Syntrophosphaera sp.]
MQKNTVRLRSANISDIGKNPARTKNEDYFGHFQGEFGDLFLVCDGMGGHEGGEIASRLAVESIRKHFETNYVPGEELATITQSIDFAQQKITERVELEPELAGMGTTLVLLLIQGVSYYIAHCGDSRIYLSRGGAINQLTKDHSEVQMMVESGIITQEQAATHPRRNFITKAIGHTSFAPDVSGPYILQQDDVFLLCSDGLTEYVKEDELHQQMEEEPQIACQNLVDMANDRGGNDNITIQIVQVQQCSPFTLREELPTPRRKKILPPLALVVTLLVFLGAVFWYARSIQVPPSPEIAATRDSLRAARAEAKRLAKEEKKRLKEERKKKGKKASEKAIDPKLAVADSTIANRLQSYAAGNPYLEAFNAMSNKTAQAKNFKFISKSEANQVIYIVPGQTIYLDYAKLAYQAGHNLKSEDITALMAIAVLRSSGQFNLAKEGWESKFIASGTSPIDDQTWNAARELYKKYDSVNADQLFNNPNRFARLRARILVGPYGISLNKG